MADRKRLPILCPQEYEGTAMRVAPCTKCVNWQKIEKRCDVYMGCEGDPLVALIDVPDCPIANRCQHQIQALPAPCAVRARGMICESVAGESDPRAFSASYY